MMLKKLKLCALLMTACVSTLAADFYNSSNGQWRITGEYLYLMPSVDDTYFVIDSPITTTFPNGTRENNDFDFHSGYRVGGAYRFDECSCDKEIQFYYSHLGFSQSRTITGDFLWATVGRADFASDFENYTGTATSDLHFKYQRYDALYAQQVHNNCGLDVCVVFGLEAAQLKLNESYSYLSGTTLGTVDEHSKTNGIGPQFGLNVGYELYRGSECSCMPGVWSFNVHTSGSLLAARTRTSSTNVLAGATILDVSDSHSWRVVPAMHTRVGLNYDMTFGGCWDTSLEIGYEFNSYLRGLARTSYPDDVADGLAFTNYYNYDTQGLYVSASVRF